MVDTPENRVSSLLSVVELIQLTCDDLKTALIELKEEYSLLKKENESLKMKLFTLSNEAIGQISRDSSSTYGGKSIE